MKVGLLSLGVVIATLLIAAMLFTPGWVHPPIIAKQNGYRGTGEDQITTAATQRILKAANVLPEVIEKASPDGERADRGLQEREGPQRSERRSVQPRDGGDHPMGLSGAGLRILPRRRIWPTTLSTRRS